MYGSIFCDALRALSCYEKLDLRLRGETAEATLGTSRRKNSRSVQLYHGRLDEALLFSWPNHTCCKNIAYYVDSPDAAST